MLLRCAPPTPTSTFTPTATETITPTLTPTETATFTPTLTFTPTPVVTETATPLFTDTPVSVDTPTATTTPATSTPTALPQETGAANTPTLEATLSPTATLPSTASATPTVLPGATTTPAPSETPTGAMGPVFDAVQTYELMNSEQTGNNGEEVLPAPGDLLLIRTTVENMGGQSARNVAFYQTFGNYLAFVEDSIAVDRGRGRGNATTGQTRNQPVSLFIGRNRRPQHRHRDFSGADRARYAERCVIACCKRRVEADNALPVLTRDSSQDAVNRPTVIRLKPLSALWNGSICPFCINNKRLWRIRFGTRINADSA
ncbi:MAG: hypothetical protein R3A44_17440 [Caldilineaceae bacterium]